MVRYCFIGYANDKLGLNMKYGAYVDNELAVTIIVSIGVKHNEVEIIKIIEEPKYKNTDLKYNLINYITNVDETAGFGLINKTYGGKITKIATDLYEESEIDKFRTLTGMNKSSITNRLILLPYERKQFQQEMEQVKQKMKKIELQRKRTLSN